MFWQREEPDGVSGAPLAKSRNMVMGLCLVLLMIVLAIIVVSIFSAR